jgi:hypothetical protein
VPVKLEGKYFVGSVERLAWAKANGCPWDYNTGHTWELCCSSLPGRVGIYRSRGQGVNQRKEPTPNKAGWIL